MTKNELFEVIAYKKVMITVNANGMVMRKVVDNVDIIHDAICEDDFFFSLINPTIRADEDGDSYEIQLPDDTIVWIDLLD